LSFAFCRHCHKINGSIHFVEMCARLNLPAKCLKCGKDMLSELPSQQVKQTGVGEQHDDGRVDA
jgi:hypothetical protein